MWNSEAVIKNSSAGCQWTLQLIQYLLLSLNAVWINTHLLSEQTSTEGRWSASTSAMLSCSFMRDEHPSPWLQLSVRAKFISANCLEPWVVGLMKAVYSGVVETSTCLLLSSQPGLWPIQKMGWDKSAWIIVCLAQPSLDCNIWDSSFIRLPFPANELSHLPKIVLYKLGFNFFGIQEVQQHSRVGRSGMSPMRELCTVSK